MVTLTRGDHQIVDWNKRQREVARGRRNIRTIRKDMKELYAEREKIHEKIDQEMKRLNELP
jgi:F0F1-type ATP synthase membrane subunit b/b'